MFQQTLLTATTLAGGTDEPTVRQAGTVVSFMGSRRAADRYGDLADRHLAAKLAAEDAAVESGLSPFERLTCAAHRRWIHQCIASPQHVSPVTGHRWCRDCQFPLTVVVDELTGDATMTCPRCQHTPQNIATRQIVRACRASLATVHDHRSPHVDQRKSA